MSVTAERVKYPYQYFRMIEKLKEYEKEAKARLDAQVYVYRCEEYDQRSLEKLIPK